jgi:sugar phosphate isomerase/epimerase
LLWKIAAGDWIWGSRVTRFFSIPATLSPEKTIERIAELGFDGLELGWTSAEAYPPDRARQVSKKISDLGLDVANAYIDTCDKWPFGAFTNPSEAVRKQVVAYVKSSTSVAKDLGSKMVNLWPGTDGVPLKVPYWTAWNWLVEGIRECVDYASDIGLSLSLEYKLKEPSLFLLLSNSDALLRILDEIDRKNIGATIDTGHVFQAKEHLPTIAQKLSKKLLHVHLDDNYGDWDDDLAVGTVHNFLSFFRALKEVNYKGYLCLDIWPIGDPDEAAKESKRYVEETMKAM